MSESRSRHKPHQSQLELNAAALGFLVTGIVPM